MTTPTLASMTHCAKGHLLSLPSTGQKKQQRRCRVCHAARMAARWRRVKAERDGVSL